MTIVDNQSSIIRKPKNEHMVLSGIISFLYLAGFSHKRKVHILIVITLH